MKKLLYFPFLLFLSACFFTSCDNEPLEGDFAETENGSSANCENAATVFQENADLLANATQDNYELVCANYRIALQALLDNCSSELDQSLISSIQDALTSVGDCSASVNACDQAQAAAAEAAAAFANATEENQDALCQLYTTALEAQIQACGDTDGSLQETINNLFCSPCGEAQENSALALAAFNEANPNDQVEYESLCGEYSFALQAEISACGDPDGTLLALVLDLGDCAAPEDNGPVRLLIDGQFKNFNTADVTIEGSLLSVVATESDTGDTFTFDVVLQQTGDDILQEVTLTVNGTAHSPFPGGETPFTSTVSENSGTTISGTFSGTVVNIDGEFVETSEGIIDIEY